MTVVFVALAALVILGAAMILLGRWDPGIDAPDRRAAPELPPAPWTADDVRSLTFRPGLRGYRMQDVDAALAALAAQLPDRQSAARVTAPERDPIATESAD